MQTFGGRLREVVTYKSQNARVKFFRQPRMEWYIYSKKIVKVWFPLPITGNFIDKIISYSMWQFIYGSALVRDYLYRIFPKTSDKQKINFLKSLNWDLEIWVFFLRVMVYIIVIDPTNKLSNRCVDNNDSQRINSFLSIFTMYFTV